MEVDLYADEKEAARQQAIQVWIFSRNGFMN